MIYLHASDESHTQLVDSTHFHLLDIGKTGLNGLCIQAGQPLA